MRCEQRQGPFFCFARGTGFVAAALITVETMIGIVNVNWHIRMGRIDHLDIADWDVCIEIAEVKDCRHGRREVLCLDNTATIIAAGAGDAFDIGGTQPGQQTTKTVADDAHLAVLTQIVNRRLQIRHCLSHVQLTPSDTNTSHHVILFVTQFDTWLYPVEYRWRDGEITFPGIAIADFTNMRINPEDFLNDKNAALRRTGGCRLIGRQLESISSNNFNYFPLTSS